MIEFTAGFEKRRIRHVIMDWDGTTSLTRGGWGEIMAGLFAEKLPPARGESAQHRRHLAWDELMRLNGRPAIHQMARLAELVAGRGGAAATADEYQAEYQRRMGEVVNARLAGVQTGARGADSLLVSGVREFLRGIRARGIGITLASGTPLDELIAEAELLGLREAFDAIHGPDGLGDRAFSKKAIIGALADQFGGAALMAFGDGPVELIETRAVGGLAVAVCTDEADGGLDERKRETLLAAGAHAVIADFLAADGLLL